MKKLLSLLVVAAVAIALVACKGDPTPEGTERVTFNMSLHENAQRNSHIVRQQGPAYTSAVLGRTFHPGDLLPVWERIGELANINFVNVAPMSGTNGDMLTTLQQNPAGWANLDFINGSAGNINEQGVAGNFLNLLPHIEAGDMPHFYALMSRNPAMRQSLLQFMPNGDEAIFLTPYFDGNEEIENMFLARVDWFEAILDAPVDQQFDNTPFTVPTYYNPVNLGTRTAGYSFTATVTNNVGVAQLRRNVTRTFNDGNIIDILRALPQPTTGHAMAVAFREYLAATFGGTVAQPAQGYARWSDVFAGADASYITDELIAFMYVLMANPQFILRNTDGQIDDIVMYFPREINDSRRQQFPRGLEMFGMPGVLSRNGENLFFDAEGTLHDIRGTQMLVDAVDNGMGNLSRDGIIPNLTPGAIWSDGQNVRDALQLGSGTAGNRRFGFLMFDFNATQTLVGNMNAGRAIDPDFNFRAILPPLVNWQTNMIVNDQGVVTNPDQAASAGVYFHFTGSTRAMRADAWGAPIHVANDPVRLARAIFLIDQMFNHDTPIGDQTETIGNVNLYGPQEFHDGTFEYAGQTVPRFSAAAMQEMRDLRAGSHIDWLRRELGATFGIGHIRGMGLEFQTLSSNGIDGIVNIMNRTVFEGGTFLLAGMQDSAVGLFGTGGVLAGQADNPFFNQVPSILPRSASENTAIAATTFRNFSTTNNAQLPGLIANGFSGHTNATVRGYRALVLQDNEYAVFISMLRTALLRARGEIQ